MVFYFTLRTAPSKDAIIWILDDLSKLHESSSSFRHVFRSNSTAQLLVDSLGIFPPQPAGALTLDAKISDKLTHFGSLVAMSKHISASQKQQVFPHLCRVSTPLRVCAQILDVVHPDDQPRRRLNAVDTSGSTLALVQADSVRKTLARMEEWRKAILGSERVLFRKTLLDLCLNIHLYVSRILTIDTGRKSDVELQVLKGAFLQQQLSVIFGRIQLLNARGNWTRLRDRTESGQRDFYCLMQINDTSQDQNGEPDGIACTGLEIY